MKHISIFIIFALGFALSAQTLNKRTDWLGNTFSGATQWVQNYINEIAVFENGTVLTASDWDENGRCSGLYKDGDVNKKMFQQYNGAGGHNCWGWGTASEAVAIDSNFVYIINCDGDLLRFTWDPQNIHTNRYKEMVHVGRARGCTTAFGNIIVALQNGDVLVLKSADFSEIASFRVANVQDVAVANDSTLWLLVGKTIKHYTVDGTQLAEEITDLEDPASVAVDNLGRLVVTENGYRRQVLFYDISAAPQLVQTFGIEGGISAGTPGVVKDQPLKFFSLKGADTDADGNIYVAMSRRESIMRKFTPDGELLWEMLSLAFLDNADADITTDGAKVYGVDEIYDVTYGDNGIEWELAAITRDEYKYPKDSRISTQTTHSTFVRNVEGHRLMFMSSQTAGPFKIYYFNPETDGEIAIPTGMTKGKGWALWPDAAGNVWTCDGKKIIREPLAGFEPSGKPEYGQSTSYSIPEEFVTVERLIYLPESDVMYLSGFTKDNRDPGGSWGLIGTEVIRYDNWSTTPTQVYRLKVPFDTWEGGGAPDMILPKSLAVAGDYIFVAYVYNDGESGNKPPVKVFSASAGQFVGNLRPTKEVGGISGWVDIAFALTAMQRSNGEYVVFVEEDLRAKTLVYRWNPTTDGVEQPRDTSSLAPTDFELYPNTPNPFNPTTRINFDMPKTAHVSLGIYNVLGQRIRLLGDENRDAGQYNLTWDGLNDAGQQVTSGVYLMRLQSENVVLTQKMLLVR